MRKLISTLSGREYPFEKTGEFAENGEPLEVRMDGIKSAGIKAGKHLLQRFSSFLPFESIDPGLSMGEGATPLLDATHDLGNFTGISKLLLKNETQNPTWSFKDRGSLTCMMMSGEMNEQVTATVSTGNMGNSMAAYGARSGIKVLVFVPPHTSDEKIKATSLYALKKLKASGKIKDGASVVIMLTGSGMKDFKALSHHKSNIVDCDLENLREEIQKA